MKNMKRYKEFINENWTTNRVNELIADAREEASGLEHEQKFDIAGILLSDEAGLEEYIKIDMGIESPVEWIASRL